MNEIIDITLIIDIILEEIALEGLEGCTLKKLLGLLKNHENELNIDLNDLNIQQLIWKLISHHKDIHFYQLKNQKDLEKAKIINDNGFRGFCSIYSNRTCIDDLIRDENFYLYDKYKNINEEILTSIIFVANQYLRNNVLCPSYKNLEYENITDLEYCVLEKIAKCRKNGVYTTGDGSLSQIFEIAPKQLHYVLTILSKHDFIVKKTVSSQKQRSIVYLKRFEQKNETNLEKLVNYLNKKSDKQEYTYILRDKLNIGQKQFKNLVALGEKQNLFKRLIMRMDISNKDYIKEENFDNEEEDEEDSGDEATLTNDINSNNDKKKSKNKTKCFRLLKLIDNNTSVNTTLNNDEDDYDENEISQSDILSLCSQQKVDLPLYTQMFQYIESCGQAGVSLKQLGYLFGFDFYKSRRIGAHLQTHPDIVTLVKETDRGKAKYQTIIMRKFLKNNKELQNDSLSKNLLLNKTSEVNVKNMECKPIQALASERSIRRKELIINYLEEHKICSKFEIDKEIRRVEELEKQKGQIDAKTTKRMLMQLQKEDKLRVFEFKVKNKTNTGVCLASINEEDDVYKNYLSTFTRTFDFCINTTKKSISTKQVISNDTTTSSFNESIIKNNDENDDGEFKLTRSYIQSIVSKIEFSFTFAKTYGLVSKIQKAIILHRYIHHILYFYDGSDEIKTSNYDFLMLNNNNNNNNNKFNFKSKISLTNNNVNYSNLQIPSSKSLIGQQKPMNIELEKEYKIVNSCVPSACYSKELSWKTFIPPLKMNENIPKNCLFISDILSCMPLSVFTSIVAINYKIPGLLSLLKHPYKRHILIKDLPSEILAAFIHDRRYLQRILSILQFLACLNLINFVEHPTIHNQSPNRSVESQMIFVSRHVYMRDTSVNNYTKWSEIKNFDSDEFHKLTFKFNNDNIIVDYWQKLLKISLNTYKFNLGGNLKESKKLRSILHKQTCQQLKIKDLNEFKTILGDHLGPGGFDSQLFLNSYANWTLVSSSSSSSSSSNSKNNNKDSSIISIEYDDKIDNIYSELALQLPFGILRDYNSNASISSTPKTPISKKKKNSKRKSIDEMTDTDIESPIKKNKLLSFNLNSPVKLTAKRYHNLSTSSQDTSSQSIINNNKRVLKIKKHHSKIKLKNSYLSLNKKSTINEYKINEANNLIRKAKNMKIKNLRKQNAIQTLKSEKQSSAGKEISEQKRAVWNKDEDDLILLIKIASLYFLPNEKTIQFKIIHDIMNDLMPSTIGKKIKSFGRRMKVLLKSKLNRIYISNKLELCKQNDELTKIYTNVKLKRNSISNQTEQINLYKRFILDIKSKLNKNLDDLSDDFKLPKTINELYSKYIIKSQNDIFKQESYFKQPENSYEIVKNTLHSAIHSSILINDKTPRDYEASKLFEQYKDNLLTEVITTMSRQHNMIAPTKCSEMKKKNITAFSKHVGRAYHISQRYQYKWLNNTPATIFYDAKKFCNRLNCSKLLDCTDSDDAGMTCFLAHTIEDKNLDVKVEVPNKIWVSKLL